MDTDADASARPEEAMVPAGLAGEMTPGGGIAGLRERGEPGRLFRGVVEPARMLLTSHAVEAAVEPRVGVSETPSPRSRPGGTERVVLSLQARTSGGDAVSVGSAPLGNGRSGAFDALLVSIGVERDEPRSARALAWSVSTRPLFADGQLGSGSLPESLLAPRDLNEAAGRLGAVLAAPEADARASALPQSSGESSSESSGECGSGVRVALMTAGSVRPSLLIDLMGGSGPLSEPPLSALRWLGYARWVSTVRGAGDEALKVTDLAFDLVTDTGRARD